MKHAEARLFVAEPPAHYLARPPLVVDCSVLSSVVFQEGTRATAMERLRGKDLHAPYLLEHELVSVAIKKQRLGWKTEAVALAFASHAEMATLHRTDIEAQHALAVQYKLSACDAAYLWLAAELKAPFATFDEKLATAASAHLSSLS